MPRAIWSGSISFGLVSVPIKLYSAVRPQQVHFHQLDADTGARVRYKRVAEDSGDEVPYDQVVKGYELSDDTYVTFSDEELDELAPEDTRLIDIEEFVELQEIDPIHFDKAYWLAADGRGAGKAYRLLTDALADSERVAVGRFVMRTKQHLAALRPVGRTLALHTMVFPDEIVDAKTIDGTNPSAKVSAKELAVARQLIDSLTVSWKPGDFADTYRETLLKRVKAKAKGEEVVVNKPAPPPKVVDLMEALEASLRERQEGTRGKASARKSTARKAPARKSTAGKARKPAARKPATRKPAARKAPARKSA
jgi:DNA end-binding protein Ku